MVARLGSSAGNASAIFVARSQLGDGRGRRLAWWCRSLPVRIRASMREARLPAAVGVGPLRHPSHPRAWGWRAVQSELVDGIS